jgi:aminoglycoside 2'-N-acetyltransferase I
MMPELVRYADNQLPGAFRSQILALHRGEWPEGYSGAFHGRDWIQRPWFHPTHWVLLKNGVVVSYVGVTWKYVVHADEQFKTYGLSGVVTHPAFRRQGHGRRLVDAATESIARGDADIGLFTCAPALMDFYAASGWLPLPETMLFGGPRSAPYASDELTMMGFFSEKGKRGRAKFESAPIFFDDDLW